MVSQSGYKLRLNVRRLSFRMKEDQEVIPILRSPLIDNPPSPGKVCHILGPTSLLFSSSGVGSFSSHKSQISESAVRRDLRFFVPIRED